MCSNKPKVEKFEVVVVARFIGGVSLVEEGRR
jgi:hypothetical protein